MGIELESKYPWEKEFEKHYGFGKAKVGLMICAVLVVILAISSVWLLMRVENLQGAKSNLQIQVNNLQIENSQLEGEIDSLSSKYDSYIADHHYSDDEYDEAQFSFYYINPEEQKLGVYNLDDELQRLEWTEPYQSGVFDCSEMSACLEWYLENNGWHAKIYVGDTPFGSGKHAWLIVEASQGKYMPVESTLLRVVWWEDPNFDRYWEYDYRFETIQDALAYSETEYDWWEIGFCPLIRIYINIK